jgi:endonuclease YncB( thermonuclease family)
MARRKSQKRHKSRVKKKTCRVHSVHDGDTITVEWGKRSWLGLRKQVRLIKVRLAYIDTPELHHGTSGAATAKRVLDKLITKKWVILEYEQLPDGNPRRGMYDRILAVVFLERVVFPNININELLLRKGLAQLYDDPDNITPHHWKRFTRAERYAKRKHLGIWKSFETGSEYRVLRTWIFVGIGILFGLLIGLVLV